VLLIPAIDLKDGQCVQLRQGVMASATTYSDDPPGMARRWRDAGARRLHVVDLDGAFAGRPVNHDLVAGIVDAAAGVPVQVGGGIRDVTAAAGYLDAGASQVIAGTRAAEDPDFLRALAAAYPGRVILGLDARDGRVATRGWETDSEVDALDFVGSLGGIGLFAIVYTDIRRDGMLTGVNATATRRVAEAASVPVIASGGVRSLDDLSSLKALGLASEKLIGVISGSALYEGTLDFADGQSLLDASAGQGGPD